MIHVRVPWAFTIHGGPHIYPSPLGDLHLDTELDEITLMRLIDGLRDTGLVPLRVFAVHVHGPNMITFDYYETDADGWMRFDDDGDPIRNSITVTSPRRVTPRE